MLLCGGTNHITDSVASTYKISWINGKKSHHIFPCWLILEHWTYLDLDCSLLTDQDIELFLKKCSVNRHLVQICVIILGHVMSADFSKHFSIFPRNRDLEIGGSVGLKQCVSFLVYTTFSCVLYSLTDSLWSLTFPSVFFNILENEISPYKKVYGRKVLPCMVNCT